MSLSWSSVLGLIPAETLLVPSPAAAASAAADSSERSLGALADCDSVSVLFAHSDEGALLAAKHTSNEGAS